MKPALVLYVPVIHAGYLRLFQEQKDRVDGFYLLGDKLVAEFATLHHEIRALPPEVMKKEIEALGYFTKVEVLTPENTELLKERDILSADEEVSHRFVAKYLPGNRATYLSVFLRWDEKSVLTVRDIDTSASSEDAQDREFIKRAGAEALKSSDWWRQVGAIVVKDGKTILETHNHHVPSEQMPYINGDPRDVIEAGKHSHLSTALHAEQSVIVEAARKGISLEDTSLFLTVFPCVVCAKLVAYSGIKKVYFATGHASLDGEQVLKANNVELIQVKVD